MVFTYICEIRINKQYVLCGCIGQSYGFIVTVCVTCVVRTGYHAYILIMYVCVISLTMTRS